MLPVAADRSSSDGVVIRYVVPVLQITSRFHNMGPMGRNPVLRTRDRLSPSLAYASVTTSV